MQLRKGLDVLVLPGSRPPCLDLFDPRRGALFQLDAARSVAWGDGRLDFEDADARELVEAGFLEMYAPGPAPEERSLDMVSPAIVRPFARWHSETPDLCVLFNTAPLAIVNPLLVLGTYGSFCWRALAGGTTIGALRRRSSEAFGVDEVVPFLSRLRRLGFIRFDGAEGERDPDRAIVVEHLAPRVQGLLRQSVQPWYVLWETNTTCDLRCRVCYLPQFSHDGPDPSRARAFARELASATSYVCLLGGEALLRSDLEELIGALRAEGAYVKIITNGRRLTGDRARSLVEAGTNQIEVSFDGLRPETHESSRGHGTFEAAIAALDRARKAGIPRLGIVLTLHSGNEHELSSLPSFMDRAGVRECYLSRFKKTGSQGRAAPWLPLHEDRLAELRRDIDAWNAEGDRTVVLMPSCSCGRTSVVVGYDGGVRSCSFSYVSQGNAWETPLETIWAGMRDSLPPEGPFGICKEPSLGFVSLSRLRDRGGRMLRT